MFAAHHGRYGSPRITAELREAGERVSENAVAALMRELGRQARPKRRRRSTQPIGAGPLAGAGSVGRAFRRRAAGSQGVRRRHRDRHRREQAVLGQHAGCGLPAVVGFTPGEHHDAALAYAALAMPIAVRGGPDAVAGVVFHTDQDSAYTAGVFRVACHRLDVQQSMGRVGSALDTAVIQPWHSTQEFDLRRGARFATRAGARRAVPSGSTTTTTTGATRRWACARRSPTSRRGPARHRSRQRDTSASATCA